MARNSLIQGSSTTNATKYNTASITPGANRLVLAFVANVHAGPTAATPAASGNNLSWVQVATIPIQGALNRRLTCFSATGAAPAAGALSFSFGAEQQENCAWSVFEYDGVDISGVVQSKTQTGTTVTSIALNPLADPANSILVAGIIAAPIAGIPTPIQPGAGMAEIHEQDVVEGTSGGSLQTEDRVGGGNVVTWTSGGVAGAAAIALELKPPFVIIVPPVPLNPADLIRRFEPSLFFHPEEKFLPSNAKRYIEACALWKAEAPFDKKESWGGIGAPFPRSPIVAKGSLSAVKTEPGTFLGDNLLDTPIEERFLELKGWRDFTGMDEPDVTATSENINSNRNAVADLYKPGGTLADSTLWYHAEFLDNAKLRRRLSTVSAPELVKVMDDPKLKNPALLCYYLFFAAHEQPIQPTCTNVGAKEFSGFGGEWACVALLLEQDDVPGGPPGPSDTQPFRATFIGQTGSPLMPIPGMTLPPQAEDDADPARRIVMKVNKIGDAKSDSDHPRIFVANGSHGLYLQPGSVAVTFAGNRPENCGYEPVPLPPSTGGGDDTPDDPALIFLLKILAGTILASVPGLFGGWVWAAFEGVAPAAGLNVVGVSGPQDEPAPDLVAPPETSQCVHSVEVSPAPVGKDLGNWRSGQGVDVGGRKYDFIVDRDAQIWWPNETQGGGYRGLWGSCTVANPYSRRSGMRFPSFWKMFFLAFVTGKTQGKL